MAARRAASRQLGGKARHGRKIGTTGTEAPVELRSVADVLALVTRAINDTLRMENSLARSRTIASLATCAMKAFEVSELEGRITALETLIKDRALEPVKSNGRHI